MRWRPSCESPLRTPGPFPPCRMSIAQKGAARRQLHPPISHHYISPSPPCQTAPCSWSSARPGARAPATSFSDSSLSVVVLGVVVSGHLSSSSSFTFTNHYTSHRPPYRQLLVR